MTALTFHHPQLLWLLLPALAFPALLWGFERRQAGELARFLSAVMQQRLALRPSPARRRLRLLCVLLALCFGVLAICRPQTPGEIETVSTSQIAADLVVVLDVSRSMLAEDAAPNRLQRAKAEIADLLAKLKGHRVGLVAFAGRAQVLCPLTPDYGFFRMILDRTDPRSVGRGGTRIGDGLRLAKATFSAGPGARLVLLITDGEDHDSFPLEAAQELKREGIRVVAIGFGDERGSEITLTDPATGAKSFLADRQGQLVRSRLDGKTLRDIALATEGAYIPAGVATLDLESIIREHIQPLVRDQHQTATKTQPKEHYPPLILLSLLSLLASIRLSVGGRRASWGDALSPASLALAVALGLSLGAPGLPLRLAMAGPNPTAATAPTGGPSAAAAAPAPTAEKPSPSEPSGTPRQRYNRAREAFGRSDFAQAEAGFLSARDAADADDELRFRAAFNTALSQAQRAASLTKEQPQEAVNVLAQSAAWFRDAVRLRPNDADARHNLELVLRRLQTLRDQLNKGQNTLEARLARIIADERTLRDRIRGLLSRIAQAGASDEPLAFHGEFEDASTFQRTLLSEAGAVLDLAGDERDRLSQRAEKDRKPEESARLIQLQNLEHYLNLSRGTLADIARLLRRLQGERAHRQADVGVTQLKRAQEQLQDPVTVLKGLVADQLGTLGQTRALSESQAQSQRLTAGAAAPPASTPVWLTPSLLADEQREIKPRTSELLARLQAGVEHAAKNPSPPADPSQPQAAGNDPRQAAARERMLQAAREAIPLLNEAMTAMDQVQTALASEQLANAVKSESSTVALLLRALERFSGVRDLIELAYGEQQGLAQLLGSGAKAELAKLAPAERAALLTDALTRNRDRVARLSGLFADELKALQSPPAAPAAGQEASAKEAEEARQAETQRYQLAETKRAAAGAALERLATLLTQRNPVLLPTVEEGREHLAELRRLFFSIVEHLKELLRNQGETLDRTNTAQAQREEAERRRRAGPLVGEEDKHAELGKALAEALAAQADQAANAKEPSAKQAQKPLSEAAEEVRKAHAAMLQAATLLKPDGQAAQGQSLPLDLEPAMEQEKGAMAHLEAAIRILEPPQQKPQQNENQKSQPEQQQQLSQEQAARRLQAIREREAERQRKRQQPGNNEPVEKDW
ncbi:MAG TPA: VWA domain-containing protein [Pseudomonadota bacterium]|nr:VWA domain-containing protein [Pseudomonadota bacterium]